MTKRAAVPGEVFTRKPTALEKLTGRSNPENETVEPLDGDTVQPQNGYTVSLLSSEAVQPLDSNNVKQQSGSTVLPLEGTTKAGEKTTFYLRPDQLDKLDELVLAFKKRTGKRVNRNDIVRQLIDQCELDNLV